MIVEQVWTGNAYRNFNYLIACPDTGEALAVDPLDHQKCLSLAKAKGWQITQVLNTHEHGDHTGGNQAVISATGAKLLAHANAKNAIPGMDVGLGAGDVIKIGSSVELEALDTPGHTMSHVCLLSRTDQPALFCGDTLFNAGAGNCHNGGHPAELYDTFAGQLAQLPGNTLIYPGHDYLGQQLRVYSRPRTRQYPRQKFVRRSERSRPRQSPGFDIGPRKRDQYVFPAAQPHRYHAPPRTLS